MDKIIVTLTVGTILVATIAGIIILSPLWISCWFCDKITNRLHLAWKRMGIG